MRYGFCFILAAILAIVVGITVLPGPDGAALAQGGGECPSRLGNSQVRECRCTAQATQTGTVWGSDFYTTDSALCRAARHAGVIDASGGFIRFRIAEGRNAYLPSQRNGVSSNPWGSYGSSLVFDAGDDRGYQSSERFAEVSSCPRTGTGLARNSSLTCQCAAGADAVQFGNVWGSGPYTADSALCRAARHAGAIGPQGGIVTIRSVAGRGNYQPSQANGVSSNPWGSFANAYIFER